MKIRQILALSATAALMGTASPAQTTDPQIEAIADELGAMGYSRIEVKRGMRGMKVEATGAPGKLERTYDRSGNMVREEFSDSDDRDGEGRDDDDRDDDDRDDDDRDDDRDDDDDHDGGRDDDDGHDGNDDSDDDDDDDGDDDGGDDDGDDDD